MDSDARRGRAYVRMAGGVWVRHPNVVRTLSAGAEVVRGTPFSFLVMEHVEGRPLP